MPVFTNETKLATRAAKLGGKINESEAIAIVTKLATQDCEISLSEREIDLAQLYSFFKVEQTGMPSSIQFKTRGKVPTEKANLLLNAMLDVAEIKKAELLEGVKANNFTVDEIGHPPMYSKMFHSLRMLAEFDMQYPSSTHPAYSPWEDVHGVMQPARVRLIPYCGWTLDKDYYVDGCNDTHWGTVQNQVKDKFVEEMKRILNSVGHQA